VRRGQGGEHREIDEKGINLREGRSKNNKSGV
jgi:hypothetical protein